MQAKMTMTTMMMMAAMFILLFIFVAVVVVVAELLSAIITLLLSALLSSNATTSTTNTRIIPFILDHCIIVGCCCCCCWLKWPTMQFKSMLLLLLPGGEWWWYSINLEQNYRLRWSGRWWWSGWSGWLLMMPILMLMRMRMRMLSLSPYNRINLHETGPPGKESSSHWPSESESESSSSSMLYHRYLLPPATATTMATTIIIMMVVILLQLLLQLLLLLLLLFDSKIPSFIFSSWWPPTTKRPMLSNGNVPFVLLLLLLDQFFVHNDNNNNKLIITRFVEKLKLLSNTMIVWFHGNWLWMMAKMLMAMLMIMIIPIVDGIRFIPFTTKIGQHLYHHHDHDHCYTSSCCSNFLKQICDFCRRRRCCAPKSIIQNLSSSSSSIILPDNHRDPGTMSTTVATGTTATSAERRSSSSSSWSSSSSKKNINNKFNYIKLMKLISCVALLIHQQQNRGGFLAVVECQHAKQVATIPGQLVIGALFSIREQPTLRAAQTRTCGEVREQYGIHRVEASFQTIDTINSDPNILPNITLGIEIRDSCWYSAIALEQSIEFIRDAMAASEEKAFQSSSSHSSFFGPGSVYDVQGDPDHSNVHDQGRILGMFPASPFGSSSQRFNVSTPCPKVTKKAKNIVGVIGPASSTNTIQVQNLLQLFNIPQIGYSATSKELSGKNFFKFFLRVVPSDHHQAQVVSTLFRHYKWTYISVVYTDGSYGSGLMEIFKTNAQESGICIAYMESIPPNGDDEVYDQVVQSLLAFKNAKVVACFCEGSSVRALLQAKRRLNITTEFMLVGSDGWSDRPDVVKGLEKEAQGSLTVRIYSPIVEEFDEYYFKLTPFNNHRNPWFREFWEAKFNCSLRNLTGQIIVHPNNVTFTQQCTGEESLADFLHKRKPRYKQDNKMSFVVKAIWTMAHGLHNMQKSICKNVTGLCNEMLPVNGSILLHHLNKVKFKWKNEWVEFDENGDPPGRYDIMNYQELKKGEYDYVQVGEWNSDGTFSIDQARPIQWPREREMIIQSNYTEIKVPNRHSAVPESVCSKPCPKGQAKNIQSDSVKCCWICVPCRENEYLTKEEKCMPCKIGTWPNENLTGCKPIPVEYIRWTDTWSLVAISISLIGFIMTLFTMVVFIRHNDTPMVKASTRELSYIIMFGMFLCHATTFALIAKPTKFTCYLTRILPGLSFAIMYSALVTKTNRIARILAGSKKRIITKKPRFMSATAQVVITWLLVSVEVGIIVTVLIKEPADKMLKYPSLDRVVLTCNTRVLGISAPLGFDFVLIGFCTLYAIKTRNVPENFNEAKFIGFTMYTTLVIWIAFVPIYYNSDENVITLSLCISFSAIVALVLLFFPKIYIILFKPEKNNRSYFTTAKNVRCHIGYMQAASTTSSTGYAAYGHHSSAQPAPVSRHSSHSVSDFSVESPRNHSIDAYSSCRKQEQISTIQNQLYSTGQLQAGNIGGGQLSNSSAGGSKRPMLANKNGQQKQSPMPAPGTTMARLNQQQPPQPKKGFFQRLRISKQDKIAANVAEHIRAVRAAEALDRQTARGRRFNVTSQSFSEKQEDMEMNRYSSPVGGVGSQSSSTAAVTATATAAVAIKQEDYVGLLSRHDTATRRIRIIHLLRRTFGDELEKLPQFSALVNCLKYECSHTFTESAVQTNGAINGGKSVILQNDFNGANNNNNNNNNNGVGGVMMVVDGQETLRRRNITNNTTTNTTTDTCTNVATIVPTIGTISDVDVDEWQKWKTKPTTTLTTATTTMVAKVSGSDESTSATGSVIVEENISSGEDNSQTSGVYKNIIINLGNLQQPPNHPHPQPTTTTIPGTKFETNFRQPNDPIMHNSGCSTSGIILDPANIRAVGVSNELVGILKKNR